TAARATTLQVQIFNASTSAEIQATFERLVQERSDAVFVANEPFFLVRRVQLATLAARYGLPASFPAPDWVEVARLMSSPTNPTVTDPPRAVGVYPGHIQKGKNPAHPRVLPPTKFNPATNLPPAKALGLEVPPQLLARADEVIE